MKGRGEARLFPINAVFLSPVTKIFFLLSGVGKKGAPDKPCGVGRADANPKLLLNDT